MTTFDTSIKSRNNPSSQSSSTARQVSPLSRPATHNLSGVSQERIARRAYEIWERNGRPEGQAERHWFEAEAEIRHS